MKKICLTIVTLFSAIFIGSCQNKKEKEKPIEPSNYKFETIKDIENTAVLSQGNSGTCWSYAVNSFLESEIIRISGKKIDLSEMYSVRNTYINMGEVYIRRHGRIFFDEGGNNHDPIESAKKYGLVPYEAYTGLKKNQESNDHSKLIKKLKEIVTKATSTNDGYIFKWKEEYIETLDKELGKEVKEFDYQGKTYTPKTFLEYTGLKMDDYITITSYNHIPFYKSSVLDLPANFLNIGYYNLPLDEYMKNIDFAIENGFTLAFDGDVSESTFSGDYGIAVLPDNKENEKSILTDIKPEVVATQELRQEHFEHYKTNDDHNMHIVGKVKDQNNNIYYKIKNSWSDKWAKQGYIYMSTAYMKLKCIYVLLHKDGLLPETKSKLKLE